MHSNQCILDVTGSGRENDLGWNTDVFAFDFFYKSSTVVGPAIAGGVCRQPPLRDFKKALGPDIVAQEAAIEFQEPAQQRIDGGFLSDDGELVCTGMDLSRSGDWSLRAW